MLNKNEIKSIDYKDNLMKLFKLHQNLTQWKKLLWDFDKESKLKNSLSDIHIERNTTPITSSSGSSSTSILKHHHHPVQFLTHIHQELKLQHHSREEKLWIINC